MSCVKTVVPIKMQFGMLSRVESGNHALDGGYRCPTGSGTFGVFGGLKSIVKRRILGDE